MENGEIKEKSELSKTRISSTPIFDDIKRHDGSERIKSISVWIILILIGVNIVFAILNLSFLVSNFNSTKECACNCSYPGSIQSSTKTSSTVNNDKTYPTTNSTTISSTSQSSVITTPFTTQSFVSNFNSTKESICNCSCPGSIESSTMTQQNESPTTNSTTISSTTHTYVPPPIPQYFNPFSKEFDSMFPRNPWNFNWDFGEHISRMDKNQYVRATEEEQKEMLSEVETIVERTIILVRHGQYEHDIEGKWLTEKGRMQAEFAGKRLDEFIASKRESNATVTLTMSTINRATQTASIMLDQLSTTISNSSDSLLAEGEPYFPDPVDSPYPEQAYFEDHNRIETAFKKYFYRAEQYDENDVYDVIVCHANVIRYFILRALQLPPERWHLIRISHASFTKIAIDYLGIAHLKLMGDVTHIEPSFVTH